MSHSENPPSTRPSSPIALPDWLLPLLLLGSALALGGGYFDDAWHTERGRDSFFIAPHIAIYGGVTLAAGALGLWVLLALRSGGLRAVLGHRPLVLAVLSVGVTLASAPIDNAWHLAFGRDAVIWSPPHVLGIVGTAGLAAALLLELRGSDSRLHRLLVPVAGAMVLSAFNFLVIEFETDVPQFSALWYLPVLALCASFALGLVRLIGPTRLAASRAALVHLGFVVVITALLLALGFDAPKLPLLIVPALVLDLGCARRLAPPALGLLFAGALFAAYVPALDLLGSGVSVDAGQVAIGLPLAIVIAGLVFVALGLGAGGRRSKLLGVTAAGVLLLALLPGQALAHDPGQGEDAGNVGVVATVKGERARVEVALPAAGCAGTQPIGIVARRAGVERRGRLTRRACRLSGSVATPAGGRWFLYADWRRNGTSIESWLPVRAGDDAGRFIEHDRFAYIVDRKPSSAIKWISGAFMYLLVVAFLIAIAVLFRRVSTGTLA